MVQLSRRDFPALTRLSDDGVVTDFDVVEEFLAELHRTVHLLDAVDRYPWMPQRQQEHRQSLVLGYVPVGASQA